MREELMELSYRIVEYSILNHPDETTLRDFSLSDVKTSDLSFTYGLRDAPADSLIKIEILNTDPGEKEMYAIIHPFGKDLFELK